MVVSNLQQPKLSVYEILTMVLCSKWRNNDKRDGYLNWPGRAKDDVANSGRDRISLMME